MSNNSKNYEIYKNILEKEVKAFNSYYDKLENDILDTELDMLSSTIDLVTNCKLILRLNELETKFNKVKHLTVDHFVYSSLEAYKNITNTEVKCSWLDGIYIKYKFYFPHNTETNVKFIDDRLVDLFTMAYNNYINSYIDLTDKKVYKSVIIGY